MLVTRCRCPECDTTLKLSTPVAEGKRIRCPDCGTPFTVGDGEAIRAEPGRAQGRGRRAVEEDDRDDRPVRRPRLADAEDDFDRPRRRSRDEGGNTALIVGLVVGGVLLLFGFGGVGIYFLVRSSGGSATTPNNASQPAPPAAGNPMGIQINPPGGIQINNPPFPNNPFGNPGNPGDDKLTQANYDKVQKGMQEPQVYALIGKPTLVHDNFGGPNRKALHYNRNGVLGIIVLNNGVVESK